MLGQRVNNYEIVRLLGEGGMGAVYEAEHRVIRRRVAIKVLKPELALDRELVQRFFNEARATSAIHHPNIVEIVDVGVLREGVPYLVMELLEGENLCDRIERAGKLDIAMAVDIVMQAASALEAAHQSGIVHRDLKPENLFIGPDPRRGPDEIVKVLDFGIAKLRDDLTTVPVHTLAGAVLGTPPYMSPEQCRGRDSEIDHRSDIYSLGVILYEAVCGAPPFYSDALVELLIMHLNEPPPPPSRQRSGLSPALEAVILKTLEKQPSARHQSMAELGSALAALPAEALMLTDESRMKPPPSAAARQALRAYDPLRSPELASTGRALGLDTTRPPQPERALAAFASAGTSGSEAPGARGSRAQDASASAGMAHGPGGSRRSQSFAIAGLPIPARKRRASHAWLWPIAIPMIVLAVGDRPGPHKRLTTRMHAARAAAVSGEEHLERSRAATLTPAPQPQAVAGSSARPIAPADPSPQHVTAAPATPAPARSNATRPAAPAQRASAPPQPTAAAHSSERITGARFADASMPDAHDTNPYREPAPPPSAASKARTAGIEPGYLSLDTAPWSEVFLGDSALGTTPLIRVPLPPGKHLLTLRNSELSTSTTYAVDIKSGESVSRLIGWGK